MVLVQLCEGIYGMSDCLHILVMHVLHPILGCSILSLIPTEKLVIEVGRVLKAKSYILTVPEKLCPDSIRSSSKIYIERYCYSCLHILKSRLLFLFCYIFQGRT